MSHWSALNNPSVGTLVPWASCFWGDLPLNHVVSFRLIKVFSEKKNVPEKNDRLWYVVFSDMSRFCIFPSRLGLNYDRTVLVSYNLLKCCFFVVFFGGGKKIKQHSHVSCCDDVSFLTISLTLILRERFKIKLVVAETRIRTLVAHTSVSSLTHWATLPRFLRVMELFDNDRFGHWTLRWTTAAGEINSRSLCVAKCNTTSGAEAEFLCQILTKIFSPLF